jgi:hypothetical protein
MEGAEAGFPPSWTLPDPIGWTLPDPIGWTLADPIGWTFPDPIDALGCETAGLAMPETAPFLAGAGVGRLGDGATFLAVGLAILLAAGAFLADLPLPDEWAGLAAAFFAGAIFLTFTAFLPAGLAAFFLVAIQLGFFCDEHL